MKKWGIGFLVMMLGMGVCHAQNSGLYYLDKQYESEDPFDNLTHLDMGVNALSNNVYLGRKDVNKLPYLTPYLGYTLRCGLYVNGSVSYAFTKKSGHVDAGTIEAGYDRTFGSNVLAGVHVEQYFYYKNSPGVRSSINESGGVYWLYKNDWIEPTLSFDINNGTSQDFVFKGMLDHHFQLADNKVHIYPAAALFIGTLHFYDNYYIARTLREDHMVINTALETPGKIRPVDIELSAKTSIYLGNWMFNIIPTYAVPIGEGKVTLPGKVINEKLKNTFFIEVDACYRKVRGQRGGRYMR